MDARTARRRLDELMLLDVREPWEWQAGRIEGAVHVPMWDLPSRVSELSIDRPILCVCRTGHRSEEVAKWLRAQGFDAHNLTGGVADWAASGLPFEGEVA